MRTTTGCRGGAGGTAVIALVGACSRANASNASTRANGTAKITQITSETNAWTTDHIAIPTSAANIPQRRIVHTPELCALPEARTRLEWSVPRAIQIAWAV